jgi:subtilase family serine protease
MRPTLVLFFFASIVFFLVTPAHAVDRQVLRFDLPAGVTNSPPVGRLPGTTNLDLAIGLPLRNQEALTNLLREIYDRASANFRHCLKRKQ